MPPPPNGLPEVNSVWEHRKQRNRVKVLETRWIDNERLNLVTQPGRWEIQLMWLPESMKVTAQVSFSTFQHWYTPVRSNLPSR